MKRLDNYLLVLEQRRMVYGTYRTLVLDIDPCAAKCYLELMDDLDTIIAELTGLVKEESDA